MIQDIAIVTMGGDLSNGAISNDLERTPTLFSRSHHSDAQYPTNARSDARSVTIEDKKETAPKLSNGTSFNDVE